MMQLKIRVSCYHIDQNKKKLLSSKIKVNKKVLECNLKKKFKFKTKCCSLFKKENYLYNIDLVKKKVIYI